MRKFLFAAAAIALCSSAATAGDLVTVKIEANLPQDCQINTASGQILTLGAVDTPVVGAFEYQCNFIGAPKFTFDSANKGVFSNDNGPVTVDYGIFLNDAGVSGTPSANWLKASATPYSYGPGGDDPTAISNSVTPNDPVTPNFAVALIAPLLVAGDYSDTLTITISP